jgi:hypothetical protein
MPALAVPNLDWTLGPYRIVREIGRGQFGTVFEALDAQGRRIALKLVPLHGPDSDEKVTAERQGAVLQQRFSRNAHQLVPQVLDHQRIDPYYLIAMELVIGQPLTALIKAGRVPAGRAAAIASAICRFLTAAHEFTTEDGLPRTILVHGDLKPAHILLLEDGSVRVLDFGIAKALATRNAATTNLWSSVDYASPERLESGRVNEHADFWSLGVILFEMVSGHRPYLQYERDRSRLETAIRTHEPRQRVPPDVDPRLTAIIDKLLATQIENRYQTARQIAGDLEAFIQDEPVVAFVEATRASQPTVRIPVRTATPHAAVGAATEPLPAARRAVPGLTWPHRGEFGAVRMTAEPASLPPPPAPVRPAPRRSYRPWIAAALSFLAPGLGQIYNREFLRGIFWLIVTPGFWIGTGGTLGWPFHLLSAYTAHRRARRPGEVQVVSAPRHHAERPPAPVPM